MIKRILATTALIATGVVTFAACGKANKTPEGEGANNIKYNVGQHAEFTPTTNSLNDGEMLQMPNEPTREGYTFGGWYKDKNFKQVYDFNQPINNDTTLHAKWYPVGTISDQYRQGIINNNRPYAIKNYQNLNDNTDMSTINNHAGRVAYQYANNGQYRRGRAGNNLVYPNRMSTNTVGQNYGMDNSQAVNYNNAYAGNTGVATIQTMPQIITPAQTPIATSENTSPAVANRLDNISDRIKSTGRYVKDMAATGVFVEADQAVVSNLVCKDDKCEKEARVNKFKRRNLKQKIQTPQAPQAPQAPQTPQTPAPEVAPQESQVKTTA